MTAPSSGSRGLERRPGAERNDRDAVLVRPREHARDVLGRLGEDDGRGRAPRDSSLRSPACRSSTDSLVETFASPSSARARRRPASVLDQLRPRRRGKLREEPVAAVAEGHEDLLRRPPRSGPPSPPEVRDVPDDHGVPPLGGFVPSSRRSARTRPVYVPTISAGNPRQRGDDRRPAERELCGLARAAVPAREHAAERKLERAPGFADRARLSPAGVVQIALSVAVGQRDAEAVLLGVVGLGVPKEDHVTAVSQASTTSSGPVGRAASSLHRSRRARREARGRAARARRGA